jgi:hypothetical protein
LSTPFDQFHQVQVAVRIGQFDIDAGFDRQRAGFLLVLGDKVAVRVGAVAKFPDGVVIRNDEIP